MINCDDFISAPRNTQLNTKFVSFDAELSECGIPIRQNWFWSFYFRIYFVDMHRKLHRLRRMPSVMKRNCLRNWDGWMVEVPDHMQRTDTLRIVHSAILIWQTRTLECSIPLQTKPRTDSISRSSVSSLSALISVITFSLLKWDSRA